MRHIHHLHMCPRTMKQIDDDGAKVSRTVKYDGRAVAAVPTASLDFECDVELIPTPRAMSSPESCLALYDTFPWSADMDEIYREMKERNLRNIEAGGFKPDTAIATYGTPEPEDPRRCLALSSFPAVEWTAEGEKLKARLEADFGGNDDFVLFDDNPAGDEVGQPRRGRLHWTLMQLISFADYPPTKGGRASAAYGQAIERALDIHGPFTIQYHGIIAVGTGLVAVGVCDIDINAIRDKLRQELTEAAAQDGGYAFGEPFVNNIVHSTLLRFSGGAGSGEAAEKVLAVAREFEAVPLGVGQVGALQVGEASWRMMETELAETPPVHKWQLARQ